VLSDKATSMTKENIKDNSEDNTLQNKPPKTKKRKWHSNELIGEFKKIIPPNFDGETEEGVETWLLNIGKYFHIYNY